MKIQKITNNGQVTPHGVKITPKTTETHHTHRYVDKKVSYWSQKIQINEVILFCIGVLFVISLIYVMS